MQELSGDLLRGAKAIAEFIGEDVSATYRMIASGKIPVIRKGAKGSNLFARKSAITAAFETAE